MNPKDYKDFLETEFVTPPLQVSRKILDKVHRDLVPNPFKLFFKLFALHALSALGTLSICPQFGVRLFGAGPGLMHYFMVFGHLGCMIACGFFFLGTSLIVATLFLRPEELSMIRKHRWAELGSLALLSIGFFFAFSPQMILNVALLWLTGAIAGGLFALELGWRFRSIQINPGK